MAEEGIKIPVTVPGAPDAARQLDVVAASATRVGTATAKTGLAFSALNPTLGAAAQGLARMNPELAQFVQGASSAGAAVQGTSAAIGRMGIALGATGAAVGLLSTVMAQGAAEIERLSRAADAALPSLNALMTAMRSAREERELDARVRSGRGTTAEQGAFTESERRRAGLVDRALNRGDDDAIRALRQGGMLDASRLETATGGIGALLNRTVGTNLPTQGELSQFEIDALVRYARRSNASVGQAEELERRAAVAETPDQGPLLGGDYGRGRRTGGGRGGGRRDPVSPFLGVDGRGGDSYEDSELTGAIGRGVSQSLDVKGGNEVTLASDRARAEEEMRREQLSQEREWYRERTEQRDRYYDSWASKGEEVGAVLGDTLNAVASGQMSVLQAGEAVFRQFLQQTAKSESIEAGKAAALAIANWWNPTGETYAASAVAHLAVAAAAGGAQAIVSGGGGGSGRSAERPTRIDRGGSANVAPAPTVVYMNGPVITAGTYSDVGRQIARASNRRFGAAA